MKTLTFSFYAAVLLLSQTAIAGSFEDFGRQMPYFYLSPSKESFSEFQQNADKFRDKLKGAKNGADILVAVMIARISEAHGWQIAEGAFSKRAKEIAEGKSRLAKYIRDDSQVDPAKIDVWWASFFATGDEQYLEKILRFAGLELPKGDIQRMLVIGAATWSFKANCRQHKRVLEFAKRQLRSSSAPERQRLFLKECIAFAQNKDTA